MRRQLLRVCIPFAFSAACQGVTDSSATKPRPVEAQPAAAEKVAAAGSTESPSEQEQAADKPNALSPEELAKQRAAWARHFEAECTELKDLAAKSKRLAPDQIVPTLEKFLTASSPDIYVAEQIRLTLQSPQLIPAAGWDLVRKLARKKFQYPEAAMGLRAVAIEALVHGDQAGGLALAATLLDSDDPKTRVRAARLLGWAGAKSRKYLRKLERLAGDRDSADHDKFLHDQIDKIHCGAGELLPATCPKAVASRAQRKKAKQGGGRANRSDPSCEFETLMPGNVPASSAIRRHMYSDGLSNISKTRGAAQPVFIGLGATHAGGAGLADLPVAELRWSDGGSMKLPAGAHDVVEFRGKFLAGIRPKNGHGGGVALAERASPWKLHADLPFRSFASSGDRLWVLTSVRADGLRQEGAGIYEVVESGGKLRLRSVRAQPSALRGAWTDGDGVHLFDGAHLVSVSTEGKVSSQDCRESRASKRQGSVARPLSKAHEATAKCIEYLNKMPQGSCPGHEADGEWRATMEVWVSVDGKGKVVAMRSLEPQAVSPPEGAFECLVDALGSQTLPVRSTGPYEFPWSFGAGPAPQWTID